MAEEKPKRKPAAKRTRPVKWGVVIPATIAALLLPFGVGYAIAVFVLFPSPKVEGGGGIVVPNLVGLSIAEAEQMLSEAGLGGLATMEVPNPDATAGRVTAQDPLAGQQLRAGTGVSVSVSSGRPRIAVPDVEGLTAEAAGQVLRRLGFDARILEEGSMVTEGRVFRMDPVAGTRMQVPSTVTIVVSTGPTPIDSLSDPVPPDTMSAMLSGSNR